MAFLAHRNLWYLIEHRQSLRLTCWRCGHVGVLAPDEIKRLGKAREDICDFTMRARCIRCRAGIPRDEVIDAPARSAS